MDVRESADGHYVVHHDPALPGAGVIAALDLAQIGDLAVPTLSEVLEELRGHRPRITLVELKDVRSPARLAALLTASSHHLGIVTMSFDLALVQQLRAIDDSMRLAFISADVVPDPGGFLARHRLDALAMRHDRVDGDLAAALRSIGKSLFTWTVNEADEARRVAGLGVNGIITDDPAEIRRTISPRAP
jgi:glycerophosphoryl diester phosphodiesterase